MPKLTAVSSNSTHTKQHLLRDETLSDFFTGKTVDSSFSTLRFCLAFAACQYPNLSILSGIKVSFNRRSHKSRLTMLCVCVCVNMSEWCVLAHRVFVVKRNFVLYKTIHY